MKTQTCIWNGTTAAVWHLDKGKCVSGGKHKHDVEHTVMTLAGATKVHIYDVGERPHHMTPDDPALVLPAGIYHEITATVDGTIVMNMIAGEHGGDAPQQAGVALHETA